MRKAERLCFEIKSVYWPEDRPHSICVGALVLVYDPLSLPGLGSHSSIPPGWPPFFISNVPTYACLGPIAAAADGAMREWVGPPDTAQCSPGSSVTLITLAAPRCCKG